MEPALAALQQLLGIPVKTGNFLANAKNAVTGLLSPQSQVNIYRDPIHENIKIDEQGNQTSTFEKPVASYNDPWYDPKKDPNNMKLTVGIADNFVNEQKGGMGIPSEPASTVVPIMQNTQSSSG